MTSTVAPQPLPLTVVTGFLGAGKTSFLNHLLKDPQFGKTLVLINEFGEVGIDHLLIDKIDGDMILLASGCLCCTIRGDLIATLEEVLKRRDNRRGVDFDRIIIETTGLADPIPILQTLIEHPYLRLRFYLESVVGVVDAVNGLATSIEHVEALKQIAVADHLLISKADLVKDQALNELRDQLRAINPSADQHIIAHGLYDASFVLSASLYDPHTKTYDVQKWLHDEKLSHHHHQHHHDVNRHNASIAAFCLRSENAIKPEQLELFIEFLRQLYGAHMLRVKGIICVDDDRQRPVVIHGVQHVFHPAVRLDHWPSDDHSTRIVFILYNLKEDFIRGMWDVVMNKPMPDQADAQAMRDNPLGLDQHRGLLS